MTRLLLSASLLALLTNAGVAAAQERTRGDSYEDRGFQPIADGGCEPWDVGFEFSACKRVPFPGSEADYVQVYTRQPGGQQVSFLTDPRASQKTDGGVAGETDPVGPGGDANGIEFVVTETNVASSGPVAPAPTGAGAGESTRLPNNIMIFPGRTELIPVAVGHLNSFETPFQNPAVRTSAPEGVFNVQFEQNYLYVDATEPVTLFVHEKGVPEPAIVVSLIPRQIAPRQVRLTVPPNIQSRIDANRAAATPLVAAQAAPTPAKTARPGVRFGSAQPHVERVATAMKLFGLGQVPRGFQQGSIARYRVADYCRTNAGVTFSFAEGQMYWDPDYILLIGRASSASRVELQEVWCAAHPATAAVAFSTRPVISQGQPTEFMILLRRDVIERRGPERQRLVQR
ncbi:MAG: hypothetical protein DI556_13430 [Rhodovulum sulfidophilum]|uniref:Uncharacterized protein n=1 Tax=Rhodovulum sulfidophilum TaxID=35806 RepID=A0A2W5N5P4_RHOSU|nr:MAG: hypothetical protein DI556_13430 [Rhodovulum sulfidophilum]